MTFTGLIGKICMFPLRAIINACVALRIHPNILTFVGVLINTWAAVHLARGEFVTAGSIIIRQRGTHIHPGANVGKGKDDTLFAKVTGTVRFENFGKNRKRVSVVEAN